MLSRPLLGLAVLATTTCTTLAQAPPAFNATRDDGQAARLARPVALPQLAASLLRPTVVETPTRLAVVTPNAAAAGLSACDLGCGPNADLCTDCGPPGRTWVNFRWLFWATSGQPLPVLATTSPVGTARSLAGTLGTPNTSTLYGGRRGNNDFRNGFRVNGGMWLNDSNTFGIEGDFFFLGQSRDQFAGAGNGSTIISRPFTNAVTGLSDVELVSFPNVLAGRLIATAESSAIGGGVNAVHNLGCTEYGRFDLLYGYRYFGLTDSVRIREDLTALPGQSRVPPGFRYEISDRFKTRNNFNGGVIGLSAEKRFGQLFVGARASVALGANQQITEIGGTTLVIRPDGTRNAYTGGLLAQPTNIGRYEHTAFAVLPEVGLRVGMQVGDHARVYVGYNFMYLSNVVRAGDQIDLRVNPNLLPPRTVTTGPALPAYTPNRTDFWMQGVTVGLELRF